MASSSVDDLSAGVSDTSSYVGKDRLKGKVALVTGGSKAIGKTVCEVFAKEVCLNCVDEKRVR